MSSDFTFTKENLDNCLRELGKEFRKLNGTAMKAEITLIGGAATPVPFLFFHALVFSSETYFSNYLFLL